jgi:cell filamentation protein, protein adenylyltransferase
MYEEPDTRYCYPGTDVLINKLDIRDGKTLEQFEQEATLQRIIEEIPAVEMSASGYRQIHQHLFQDIYEWAGQDRTVQIMKGNSYFCRAEFIGRELEKRFDIIRAENELKNMPTKQFVDRAAEHICELNAIHPFRDGNGRVLRAFLEILGERAGHSVDLTRITPSAWQEASIRGFQLAEYKLMRELLAGALTQRSMDRDENSMRRIRERHQEIDRTRREHSRDPRSKGRGR